MRSATCIAHFSIGDRVPEGMKGGEGQLMNGN